MMALLPYRTSFKVALLVLTLGYAVVGHKGAFGWWNCYTPLMVANYCFERLHGTI
ncbi:hypothetical protein HAV22_30535 [Massilia sp. TW-1]|uniref:Uncharacterized protein n=1 Tax=Telluria antibiotica TaxID=2717319 RepID=A0ABX0PMC7_9BURK|nr:hypothetical protein [Telluria antibiotica]NIA57971.1 hypothetical protein [Telluria antibiotica]